MGRTSHSSIDFDGGFKIADDAGLRGGSAVYNKEESAWRVCKRRTFKFCRIIDLLK